MNRSMVKFIGIAATWVGMVATLIANMAQEREMDERIKDEVSKQLAQEKKEES